MERDGNNPARKWAGMKAIIEGVDLTSIDHS